MDSELNAGSAWRRRGLVLLLLSILLGATFWWLRPSNPHRILITFEGLRADGMAPCGGSLSLPFQRGEERVIWRGCDAYLSSLSPRDSLSELLDSKLRKQLEAGDYSRLALVSQPELLASADMDWDAAAAWSEEQSLAEATESLLGSARLARPIFLWIHLSVTPDWMRPPLEEELEESSWASYHWGMLSPRERADTERWARQSLAASRAAAMSELGELLRLLEEELLDQDFRLLMTGVSAALQGEEGYLGAELLLRRQSARVPFLWARSHSDPAGMSLSHPPPQGLIGLEQLGSLLREKSPVLQGLRLRCATAAPEESLSARSAGLARRVSEGACWTVEREFLRAGDSPWSEKIGEDPEQRPVLSERFELPEGLALP